MRLFLVYVLVELAVVVALASTIGFGWTLLLLIGTFALGLALAGSQVYASFVMTDAVSGDREFAPVQSQQPAGGVSQSTVGRNRVVSNPGTGRTRADIPHR